MVTFLLLDKVAYKFPENDGDTLLICSMFTIDDLLICKNFWLGNVCCKAVSDIRVVSVSLVVMMFSCLSKTSAKMMSSFKIRDVPCDVLIPILWLDVSNC